MYTPLVIAASALAVLATAQSTTSGAVASSTVSQSMPPSATQGFNPALVNSTLRSDWCRGQRNNCPMICEKGTATNICETDTLEYTCICSNGTSPDVSAFFDTLPYFICQETHAQCIKTNENNANGQQTCNDNRKCGDRNATALGDAARSAAAAASRSATGTPSDTPGASPTSDESSAATTSTTPNAATTINTELATGAFAGLLFAVFKLLL